MELPKPANQKRIYRCLFHCLSSFLSTYSAFFIFFSLSLSIFFSQCLSWDDRLSHPGYASIFGALRLASAIHKKSQRNKGELFVNFLWASKPAWSWNLRYVCFMLGTLLFIQFLRNIFTLVWLSTWPFRKRFLIVQNIEGQAQAELVVSIPCFCSYGGYLWQDSNSLNTDLESCKSQTRDVHRISFSNKFETAIARRRMHTDVKQLLKGACPQPYVGPQKLRNS